MITSKDLQIRCSDFGISVIRFCRTIDNTFESKIIKDQLIRSSCSVGANYSEALEGESRKDFIHKLLICKKEVKEALHWLYIINNIYPSSKNESLILSKEATELLLIFSKTVMTLRRKMNNDK